MSGDRLKVSPLPADVMLIHPDLCQVSTTMYRYLFTHLGREGYSESEPLSSPLHPGVEPKLLDLAAKTLRRNP